MGKKVMKHGIQNLQHNEGMQVHKVLPKELPPELAEKILKQIQKKRYDEQVSKESVLHHLYQLKAQMGKELAVSVHPMYIRAIKKCMTIIDNKIKKIK